MRKLVFIIALPLIALQGIAQSRNCLRIMPMDEVTRNSVLIGRVKVQKTDKANYRGSFSQIAILRPVDVMDGDFTLKQINVLARSNVRCAEDNYIEGQEMIVFLEPEESLFHTVNFQYGQFPIANDIVKGWRDANNKPIDKPYEEVRQEIIAYINAVRNPNPKPETPQPAPVKPPLD
ncbi:MAG TPA: hypothetical protein VJZ26_00810 [Blastocatellia bacterium]|nr:hypothetical protein [Blastocatellia bacterium]